MVLKLNYNWLFIQFCWIFCFGGFSLQLFESDYAIWGWLGSIIGFVSVLYHRKILANDALSPLGVYQVAMIMSWYMPAPFFLDQYKSAEIAMIFVLIGHLSSEFALIFRPKNLFNRKAIAERRRVVKLSRINFLFIVGVLLLLITLLILGIRSPFEVITRMQEIRLTLASQGMYYVKTLIQMLIMFPTIYYGVLLARKELKNNEIKFYCVNLIIVCFLAFPLGSRAMFIVPFITLIAAFNIARSPVIIAKFFPLIVLILIPLYLFVLIRTNYQDNANTNWDDLMSRVLDFADPSVVLAAALESFFGRLAIIDNLANFLDEWDWKISFMSSIPDFLAQPIPRSIWEGKPYLFNMYATQYTEPYLFSMRISETIGIHAEALYNLGPLGIVLFSYLFGVVILALQVQYLKYKKNLFYQILFVQLFLLPTAWITEGLINGSANTLLILTVSINVLFWYSVTNKKQENREGNE